MPTMKTARKGRTKKTARKGRTKKTLIPEERLVPLFGYREQFLAQLLAGAAAGLDRVAVGAQGDHLLGVVRAAQGEILDVVHFQDGVSGIGGVLGFARAVRVLAVAFAAQQH